ncbi:MAG: carboxymuconolactone decarboxylase family protein [Saprospiraceae bacterium]
MKILLPERDELSPELFPVLDACKLSIGFVPNFALMLGFSPHVLLSFLHLSDHQTQGTFSQVEREAMLLAVSQFHGSPYCLAAHSAYARSAGMSEAETIEARSGKLANAKLNFLVQFARAVAEYRGQVPREMMDDFEEWGYGPQALMDVIALVIESTFSNYVGLMTKVPVDFPEVQWVE